MSLQIAYPPIRVPGIHSISGTQIVAVSALFVSGGLFGFGVAHEVFASAAETFPPARSNDTPVVSPMLEMHIANNGAVLLRGARVDSISPTNMRVSVGWDSAVFAWNIPENSATHVIDARGEKMERDELRPGDFVTVSGELERGAENIVNAAYIRSSSAVPAATVYLSTR